VATAEDGAELFAAVDRGILLTSGKKHSLDENGPRVKQMALHDPEVWTILLESVTSRNM
jgi:hypothetical protein